MKNYVIKLKQDYLHAFLAKLKFYMISHGKGKSEVWKIQNSNKSQQLLPKSEEVT